MTLKTRLLPLAAGLALAATVASPLAYAQGPGPGGPPPPGMQARMKLWDSWRASHKNVSDLQRTVRGLRGLDREPATRLTKAQASKLLAIVTKWQSKPVMSEAQAKGVTQQIDGILTPSQRKMMAARPGGFGRGPGGPGGFGGGPGSPRGMRPAADRPGGPGGMRPGGPGGPGGRRLGGPGDMRPGGMRGGPGGPGGMRGGPGGMRGGFMMGDPPKGGYNPLNPNTLPFAPMRDRAKQSQSQFVSELAQRAKGH